MKKVLTGGTLAAVVVSAAALVAAPDPDHHVAEEEQDLQAMIDLMRRDVRAEKADIVAKTMELDAEEAALFWPIYKEYEAEGKVLGDERLAIISDYAEHLEDLSDEKARDLITRAVALEGKEHALKERYLKEFLAVLPARTVARFFQVDSRINTLIDLELSGQIPLVY
jgi:gas vesicle protein